MFTPALARPVLPRLPGRGCWWLFLRLRFQHSMPLLILLHIIVVHPCIFFSPFENVPRQPFVSKRLTSIWMSVDAIHDNPGATIYCVVTLHAKKLFLFIVLWRVATWTDKCRSQQVLSETESLFGRWWSEKINFMTHFPGFTDEFNVRSRYVETNTA
jgi:hypothetical protein